MSTPIKNALAYLVATFRSEVDSYQARAYERALAVPAAVALGILADRNLGDQFGAFFQVELRRDEYKLQVISQTGQQGMVFRSNLQVDRSLQ